MNLRGRNSIAVAVAAVVVVQFVTIICWDVVVVVGMEAEAFPREALPTESGYLNIEGKSGALMFYAYYEAISPEKQLSDTPILLWLQGGPGCSGMIGNFYELGPWRVGPDLRLHQNPAPWNRVFGLLFLDSPIGSGFSIAPSEEHIPTNQDDVAKDLYAALQAFFDLNPLFRKRPFYVTGESYEDCSQAVGEKMGDDVMKSSKWMVEALVRRRPVLLYQGQFDLQDGVFSSESWISILDWEGLDNFLASERRIWEVSNELAGYVRSHSNLTHVVVVGSGHLVPADQNLHSQIMIESWVSRGLPSTASDVEPVGMNAEIS